MGVYCPQEKAEKSGLGVWEPPQTGPPWHTRFTPPCGRVMSKVSPGPPNSASSSPDAREDGASVATSSSEDSSSSSSSDSPSVSGTDVVDDVVVETCTSCCGLCCFKGCILAAVVLCYFFILIPGGILLLFHGINHTSDTTLALGCVVLALPAVVLFPLLLGLKWRSQKLKDKKALIRARKKGYENPMANVIINDEDL